MFKDIEWEKAINIRRSIRSFKMRPVEEAKMFLLQKFLTDMKLPFDHEVRVRLFKAYPNKKLYTVFTSPPDNMAFTAPTDNRSISAAGFVGEVLVLYATSLGLGTCWFGHYSLEELERIMPHLEHHEHVVRPKWGYGKGEVKGERAICITPLGYWQEEGVRFVDRIQTSFFSHKRKPLRELIESEVNEENLPPEFTMHLILQLKLLLLPIDSTGGSIFPLILKQLLFQCQSVIST